MPVTNYSIYHNPRDGFEGQLFSNTSHRSATYLNVSDEPLPIGRAVVSGDGVGTYNQEKPMTAPDGTERSLLGVLMLQNFYEKNINNLGDACLPKLGYGVVLKQGEIKVFTEVPVSQGDKVFYRNSEGSESKIGRFRNDDDGGSCVEIQNAVWYNSVVTPGLAVLSINIA